MGVVEGLTATIAQHNPEVDFQAIWASDSEEGKLDIHYREAITDLESFLARFTSATSGLFDLQALADDYVITIRTHSNWPPRLSGVLSNQIQNYLVHAIMAGWLSDFPDIKTADYGGMGAKDLDDIKELLLKKDFRFAEVARHQDGEEKNGAERIALARGKDDSHKQGNSAAVGERSSDSEVKVENGAAVVERSSDSEVKVGNSASVGERSSDAEDKVENGASVGERFTDAEAKVENTLAAEARNDDRVEKDAGGGVRASERHEDSATQHFHHDYVDWSGGRPPYELR